MGFGCINSPITMMDITVMANEARLRRIPR
jgi:hypothetical protein